jgi:hypothetical protein
MNSLVPDPAGLSPAHRERTLPPVPFGPAPLIEGEDAGAYDELLVRISAAVRPHDIFEEIWVRDIVDLVWEAFRLRRLKACVMTRGARTALAVRLSPLVGGQQADGLACSWAARKPGASAEVEEHLATAGIGLDGIAAHGLCIELDFIERIERMIWRRKRAAMPPCARSTAIAPPWAASCAKPCWKRKRGRLRSRRRGPPHEARANLPFLGEC